MKKILLCTFLVFSSLVIIGQTPSKSTYWGTIKVKKTKTLSSIPKLIRKKKSGIRVFRVRYNGSEFKETFPETYKSDLFPLVFNNRGLILTDENKQWSDNTIIGYDFEIFVGNAGAFQKIFATGLSVSQSIAGLSKGQFMWISNLYYSDSKGIIHKNKIGEFKIEKVN